MQRLFASSVLVLAVASAAPADGPAATGGANNVLARLAARREAARLRVDRAMRELQESLQELRLVERLAERVAGAKHRPAVSDAASIDSLPKEIREQIQKAGLNTVFVERASIEASVAVAFTGKLGEVRVAAGETKLVELAEPTKALPWHGVGFAEEGIGDKDSPDAEVFSYIVCHRTAAGMVTWIALHPASRTRETPAAADGDKPAAKEQADEKSCARPLPTTPVPEFEKPAEQVAVLTPKQIVNNGQELYHSRKRIAVQFQVASTRPIIVPDEEGTQHEQYDLYAEDVPAFSVRLTDQAVNWLKISDAADVARCFVGKSIRVEGTVSGVGLDVIYRPTQWTYHLDLHSLDQLREVAPAALESRAERLREAHQDPARQAAGFENDPFVHPPPAAVAPAAQGPAADDRESPAADERCSPE